MSRAFIQKRLPFKPTDIGGCQLWLDGADSMTQVFTGSNITSWNDKSGNGYHMNQLPPAAVNGPSTFPVAGTSINGQSTVYFNLTAGLKQTTLLNGAKNMYWVGRISSIGFGVDYNCYFLFGSDSTYDWHANYYSPTYTMLLTEYASSGIYNASPVSLYTGDSNAVLNTTFSNVYYPTAPSVSILSVAGLTGLTRYQGICYDRTAHCGWCGDLAEVIVFSNALTTPQHQQVESYLAQKWGMRQQLPQGHPGTRGIVYPSDPVNLLVRVPYQFVFTPSVAGTVSMWLDGADPAGTGIKPSNGATVSTWVDKSGSGINLTAVGTPTYTLSNSSVYLDGSAYLQNTNFSFTNHTIFFVSNQILNGPLYTNTTITDTTGFFPNHPGVTYYLVQSDSSWLTNTSPFANGTTYIYSIQYDSLNNINLWSNGSISPVITGTAGTITRNMFILGKRNVSGFQNNMIGNVFEVIQYNSDLGQTARQQVEGYLAWKWGLQANLPANHPYKNASPNITNQFGISRPNVFPIPPITISARARPTFPFTNTFTYSAAGNQTFQVPSTISPATITVYMWGAGAGGNTNYGGAGAMVQGVLTVIPGEILNIVVGQGGTIDGLNTFGGGGAGGGNFTGTPPTVGIGYSHNGFPQNAGSGGGRSAIQRGGTDPLNDIVVAGGGGGGSYFSSDRGGAATFSGTANPGTGGLPGLGGTQSAGGAGGGVGFYGTGLSGSRGLGGDTYNNNYYNGGGGGGGGYYGGGGGGTNGGDGAGGGGGSSLTDGLSLISGQTVKGFNSANGFTAPNTGSPYYQSGVGNGAPSVNSSPRAGGNGLIVITYNA